MEKDIKEAIDYLEWSQSQMRLGNLPDYDRDVYWSVEAILNRLEQEERVINKAIEILGEHRHYSTPSEEQNAQNEKIVNKAYDLLKVRKCE